MATTPRTTVGVMLCKNVRPHVRRGDRCVYLILLCKCEIKHQLETSSRFSLINTKHSGLRPEKPSQWKPEKVFNVDLILVQTSEN